MTQTLNNQPNQSDKASNHKKMGTGMLAIAWACLLGIIFMIFYIFDGDKTKVVTNSEGDIELHIPISRDHSYELSGKINDASAHFLVDTGASSIAIPEKIAMKANLKKGMPIRTETAGGHTTAYLTTINKLYIGNNILLQNVSATINPSLPGETILLGMGALHQLDFQQTNKTLILIQRAK